MRIFGEVRGSVLRGLEVFAGRHLKWFDLGSDRGRESATVWPNPEDSVLMAG